MNKIVLMLFLSMFSLEGKAQTAQEFNSWWAYAGDHKISDKWGVHTLYSFRRNDFVKNWQQSLTRAGVNYNFTKNFKLTVGYDWIVTFPYGAQPVAQKVNEQRIFQQAILKNRVGSLYVKHRFRFSQRFIEHNAMINRFRYRIGFSIPLGKRNIEAKTFYISAFDEMFIGFGKGIHGPIFHQNWMYAGVGYKVNKKLALNLGYMNQYLIKADNLHIESNHTLKFQMVYNLDLRKKK